MAHRSTSVSLVEHAKELDYTSGAHTAGEHGFGIDLEADDDSVEGIRHGSRQPYQWSLGFRRWRTAQGRSVRYPAAPRPLSVAGASATDQDNPHWTRLLLRPSPGRHHNLLNRRLLAQGFSKPLRHLIEGIS